MYDNLQYIFSLIFIACVLYAFISDVTQLRIPNSVSIVLLSSFAAYAALGFVDDIWIRIGLAVSVFFLLFIFFAIGTLGAGDVKYMGAILPWLSPDKAGLFVIVFAIASGVFALTLIGLRTALGYYPIIGEWPVLDKMSRWARAGICPFGVPISLAALYVAPALFGLNG